MDIMNNMKVSSSKFTFSILALVAIVAGTSALLTEDAHAAVPTFTAIHNSTTTTEIIFYGNALGVNGSMQLADWKINGVAVTAITNGTDVGAGFLAAHYGGTSVGVFNRTTVAMVTHADIGTTNSTVQYVKTGTSADIRSSPQVKGTDAFHEMAAVTDANDLGYWGIDQIAPTAVSAKVIDSKRIQVTMSETISNYNSTASDFTLNGAPGVSIGSIVANNNTKLVAGDSKIIYLTTDKPISHLSKSITLDYGNRGGEVGDIQTIAAAKGPGYTSLGTYITDDTHSYKYFCRSACDDSFGGHSTEPNAAAGQPPAQSAPDGGVNSAGVGNRLANFTGLIVLNNLNSNGDTPTYNTDSAPEVTASSVQVNSKMPQALVSSSPINVDVEVGDTVTFDFTINDDTGSVYIPYVALYTNFIDRPDDMNLFYTNNFDSISQESTTYYEWNVRSDDIAYDYSNTVSWNDASYSVVDDNSIEVTFSMDIVSTMDPTQVWLQVGDTTYNFNNLQLPLTLDVTGDELLSFENTSNQKLLGFLNESVLSTMVSSWTVTNDDLTNVEQLSSALGVQDQVLPAWTTNLATWVVEDDIYAADMIVAIEYIINQ